MINVLQDVGVVSLQLMAFMVAKCTKLRNYVWPLEIRGMQDFCEVKWMTKMPTLAVRLMLGQLYADTSYICGEFVMYMCLLITQ